MAEAANVPLQSHEATCVAVKRSKWTNAQVQIRNKIEADLSKDELKKQVNLVWTIN